MYDFLIGRLKSTARSTLLLVTAVLVLIPLGALAYGAIRSASPGTPGATFSLVNITRIYGELISGGPTQEATLKSFLLAVPSTLIATLLGVGFAWLVTRTNMPGTKIFELGFIVPMFYSGLVGIIAWTILAAPRSGWLNIIWVALFDSGERGPFNINSFWGMVWVMGLFYMPYTFLLNIAAFKGMDPAQEEAAAVSGAGLLRRIRSITLPVMLPSIAASAFFVLILSLENFSAPAALGAQDRYFTLSVNIYRSVYTFPVQPTLGAVQGSILMIVTVAMLWYYRRLTKSAERFVTVSGRGFKPKRTELSRRGKALAVIACSFMLLIGTILPLGTIIIRALLPTRTIGVDFSTLGLSGFRTLFASPIVIPAVRNSLTLAVVTATVGCILGFVLSYQMVRGRKTGSLSATDYLISMPIAIPGTVFGIGLLWAYVASPLYGTLAMLVLAFVARYSVYGVRNFGAGIMQLDKSLDEAARVSGASPSLTVRRITIPLLKSTAASAWLIIFLVSMRELSASIMVYTASNRTMSILTWNYLADGFYSPASAIAAVQVIVTGVVALIVRATFGSDVKFVRSEGDA